MSWGQQHWWVHLLQSGRVGPLEAPSLAELMSTHPTSPRPETSLLLPARHILSLEDQRQRKENHKHKNKCPSASLWVVSCPLQSMQHDPLMQWWLVTQCTQPSPLIKNSQAVDTKALFRYLPMPTENYILIHL